MTTTTGIQHLAILEIGFDLENVDCEDISQSPRHQDWCLGNNGGFDEGLSIWVDSLLVDLDDLDEIKEWLASHEGAIRGAHLVTTPGIIADEVGICTAFEKSEERWQVHSNFNIRGSDLGGCWPKFTAVNDGDVLGALDLTECDKCHKLITSVQYDDSDGLCEDCHTDGDDDEEEDPDYVLVEPLGSDWYAGSGIDTENVDWEAVCESLVCDVQAKYPRATVLIMPECEWSGFRAGHSGCEVLTVGECCNDEATGHEDEDIEDKRWRYNMYSDACDAGKPSEED